MERSTSPKASEGRAIAYPRLRLRCGALALRFARGASLCSAFRASVSAPLIIPAIAACRVAGTRTGRYLVLPDLPGQLLLGNPQQTGRHGPVVVGLLQRENALTLHFGQRGQRAKKIELAGRIRHGPASPRPRFATIRSQSGAQPCRGQQDARPGSRGTPAPRFATSRRARNSFATRVHCRASRAFANSSGTGWRVAWAACRGAGQDSPGYVRPDGSDLPNGPSAESSRGSHLKPKIQVFAKPARTDQFVQIAIGRADDADIDGNFLVAAHRRDRLLLKDCEELALEFVFQLPDLIEKQRAAMGGAEATQRATFVRR